MRKRVLGLPVAAIGLLLTAASALAAAPPAVVGQVSNSTSLSGATAVAVSGNIAYTTAYWTGELTAVNISDPSSPTIVGSTGPNPNLENGTDVTIAGHYAFVTSKNRNASTGSNDDGSGNSLTIVDISNPSAPSVVGTVTNAANPNELFGAYGVAVQGNYAFVAYQGRLSGQPATPDTSTGGFTVIDITNPAGPKVVTNIDNGSLPVTHRNDLEHATSVAISGNYAYVTAFYNAALTVIDISTPTSPKIVTSLRDTTHMLFPNNVAVAGNYAYVANQVNAGGIQFAVVSIANPASPVIVGSLSNAILAGDYTLRVRGRFAYAVAPGASTMAAINITNPSGPQLAAYVQDSAHLFSVIGVELDSTGGYVVAASPQLSTEVNSIYPPFPTNTGTISVIQLDPVPIAVSISSSSEPPNPTNQTSADFRFSVNDQISTVACKLDGAPLGPCTSVTSEQLGSLSNGSHTFTVQATDAAGNTATDSYSWTVGIQTGAAPRSMASPTISGEPVQHARLTGGLGSWTGNPAPSLSEQWLRCNAGGSACHAIAGAMGARYTVTAADVGLKVKLSVRAVNASGSGVAQSAATAIVKADPTGSLTGVARGKANLHLTGSADTVISALNEIDISLPRAMRFVAHERQLVAGIRVIDQRGKRVAFTVVLRHGTLVLTLKRAVGTAHVTIGPRALGVSAQLASRVRSRRTQKLTVTVTFGVTGGPRFRTALALRVS